MILPRQRSISHRSIWSNKRCFLLDRERERHEDKEKEGTFRVWFIPILCAPLRIDFPRINYPTNLHRDYVYRKLRVITQHSFSNIYIYIYYVHRRRGGNSARKRKSFEFKRREKRKRERGQQMEKRWIDRSSKEIDQTGTLWWCLVITPLFQWPAAPPGRWQPAPHILMSRPVSSIINGETRWEMRCWEAAFIMRLHLLTSRLLTRLKITR